MAKPKFDGVIEAAHYAPDGKIAWVRAYLRRGAVFSDRVQLDRAALIEQLKAGKRFYVGKRQEFLAGTFEVQKPLQVVQKNGHEIVVAGSTQAERDYLEGAPVL